MLDEKITEKVIKKIEWVNLPSHIKGEFVMFCLIFPMSDKHAKIFINLDTKAGVIAYLHKHLMRTATKNGVPRVYISEYYDLKERINHRWYKAERDINIIRMQDAAKNIMKATQQMDRFLNSRKMKIQKLKENIELDELENKS